MKKFIYLTALVFSTTVFFGQEEMEVKGNVPENISFHVIVVFTIIN